MFKSVVCLTLSLLSSVIAMDTGPTLPPAAAEEQSAISPIQDLYENYVTADQAKKALKVQIVAELNSLLKTGKLSEADRAIAIEIAKGIKSPSLAKRLDKSIVNPLGIPQELTDAILGMATKGSTAKQIRDMLTVSKWFQNLFLTAPIHLNLSGKKINGDLLGKISVIFPNLTSLDLEDTGITNADLVQLKNFPNLTSLSLKLNQQITDAGLKHLKSLTKLTSLNLNFATITDAGLKDLNGLKHLTSLMLSSTKITDVGLKHLNDLTKLTTLVLINTEITDAGLEYLKGLGNLKDLFLRKTQTTDAGRHNLRQVLPNCEISL